MRASKAGMALTTGVVAAVLAGCRAPAPAELSRPLSEHSPGELLRSYAESSRHAAMYGGMGPNERWYLGQVQKAYLSSKLNSGADWPRDDVLAMYDGRVREGMTMDLVVFAWGGPWEQCGPERSPWGEVERWRWGWAGRYSEPWREATFRDGVLIWWTERPESHPSR
jgi:hypothetical protein